MAEVVLLAEVVLVLAEVKLVLAGLMDVLPGMEGIVLVAIPVLEGCQYCW